MKVTISYLLDTVFLASAVTVGTSDLICIHQQHLPPFHVKLSHCDTIGFGIMITNKEMVICFDLPDSNKKIVLCKFVISIAVED